MLAVPVGGPLLGLLALSENDSHVWNPGIMKDSWWNVVILLNVIFLWVGHVKQKQIGLDLGCDER